MEETLFGIMEDESTTDSEKIQLIEKNIISKYTKMEFIRVDDEEEIARYYSSEGSL